MRVPYDVNFGIFLMDMMAKVTKAATPLPSSNQSIDIDVGSPLLVSLIVAADGHNVT